MSSKYRILIIIAPISILLDQITKYWATSLKLNKSVTVIEGYFDFIYRENKGAAWSFLANSADSFRVPFFIGVTIIALIAISIFFLRLRDDQKILQYAFSLIIGGALGNFIDRIIPSRGAVIDFIDWHIKDKHWPTFNIADVVLVVGMGLIFIDIIQDYRKNKNSDSKEENSIEKE